MNPMLNIGIRAARAAGRIITQNMYRLDSLHIEKKQRNDFVTEIDRKAESEIINVLLKAYPTHALLCEESGLIGEPDAEFQWVIDPLDGTTNFIHHLPHFSISIGLLQKQRLHQAIIYDPIRQELFTAGKGEGAYLDGKRLRVSGCQKLDEALLSAAFVYKNEDDFDFIEVASRQLTAKSAGLRHLGSSALDLAYVAAGRIDGCWNHRVKPWDIAAGALIVREAGGLINGYQGDDDWMSSGEVIAATPKIQHQILKIMQPIAGNRA